MRKREDDQDTVIAGPSFKRGPPKGYIQAIEHRLRLAESLLGAIVHTDNPSAQQLVSSLRSDGLANILLNEVSTNPFGATSEGSVGPTRADGRSPHKQPRVDREIVSLTQRLLSFLLQISTDTLPGALPDASADWPDTLARCLQTYSQSFSRNYSCVDQSRRF